MQSVDLQRLIQNNQDGALELTTVEVYYTWLLFPASERS